MTPEAETAHTQQVKRYYDRNSAAFERLGQGNASIHRAVWGPGVSTRRQAFHHVDELILECLPDGAERPTVVDLGCGLGASLLYLAGRRDLSGEGITISPQQAARARELIAEARAGDRVRCREGNFLDVPGDLVATADVAFSIEAFLHSPDAGGYFREAAKVLKPGGTLVVCDDFLNRPVEGRDARLLGVFREGWRVGSLLTVDQVRETAAAHGLTLVRDLDLSDGLELRRLRDRWISLVVACGRVVRPSGEYWLSLAGGDALQRLLVRGVLSYRFLRLVKNG